MRAAAPRCWNLSNPSVLRRRCSGTAHDAGQKGSPPCATVDLAARRSRPCNAFGDTCNPFPVDCLIHARPSARWIGTTLTVSESMSNKSLSMVHQSRWPGFRRPNASTFLRRSLLTADCTSSSQDTGYARCLRPLDSTEPLRFHKLADFGPGHRHVPRHRAE